MAFIRRPLPQQSEIVEMLLAGARHLASALRAARVAREADIDAKVLESG
jgi:hypothetical protein